MNVETTIVALFAVAAAVAMIARTVKMPYTVALVVAGVVLGGARAFTVPNLTKELLYSLFLPGLVFEAAFHLDFKKYWQNKIAIHALAVPGVALSIAVTAIVLAFFAKR